MENLLRTFLRSNREILNISHLELKSKLPKTKLSHFIAGRRHLSKYEVIDLCAALQPFLKAYVSLANEIGALLDK